MSEEEILETIDRVSRSIVNINTLRVLQDYFYRRAPLRGVGSGFIVEADGHIVTNAHVVSEAERIGVSLYDGTLIEGSLVGSCRRLDVSLVKVDHGELPAVEMGDSDGLRVGQRVYAIGNPFGLEGGPTVTSGVVSALNRTIQDRRTFLQNLVQTDAAINPGNSGGPLVDASGRAVAMNTAIIPYAQGIGFAIPINTVRECVEQIKTHGRFTSPWIGVQGVTVTPRMASYYGLGADRGVLVTNVVEDSPASRAGLRAGDVITEFGGEGVATVEGLRGMVEGRRVGEVLEAQVVRGRGRGYVSLRIEGAT